LKLSQKIVEGQISILDIGPKKHVRKQLIMTNEKGKIITKIVFPVSEPVEQQKYKDFDNGKIEEIENLFLKIKLGLDKRLVIAMLEEHSYVKLKYYLENFNRLKEITTIAEFNNAIRNNELRLLNAKY